MSKANSFLILVLVSFFLSPSVFAAGYLNGTLLRASGDIKVYLVNNNTKRWVSSLEVFNSNGFKWRDVRVVSKKKLSEIKEGEAIIAEPLPASSVSPTPSVSVIPTSTLVSPVPARASPEASSGQAKINKEFPAPDYIRADWLISHATVNYGHIGQKITFKYSDKEKDKIENFRLYEKKPGEKYFYKIAAFEEVLSTGCEDIDIDGEWMIIEGGQCGYWTIQRIVPPARLSDRQGERGGATAYLPSADYLVGEDAYYVAGVDKDGKETMASPEAKIVFLNPVSILTPINGQPITGVYPNFRWTIAGWPADSTADYFIMISDRDSALNPVWTKQLKVSSGEKERQFFYDGLGLNPESKYKVNIYGYYRKSEHEPDYISIPFSVPEFWIKRSGWSSLFKSLFGLIFKPFTF